MEKEVTLQPMWARRGVQVQRFPERPEEEPGDPLVSSFSQFPDQGQIRRALGVQMQSLGCGAMGSGKAKNPFCPGKPRPAQRGKETCRSRTVRGMGKHPAGRRNRSGASPANAHGLSALGAQSPGCAGPGLKSSWITLQRTRLRSDSEGIRIS